MVVELGSWDGKKSLGIIEMSTRKGVYKGEGYQ